MQKNDRRKVEFLRQVVEDNVQKLGTEAVRVMADDMRKLGYTKNAALVDVILDRYSPGQYR